MRDHTLYAELRCVVHPVGLQAVEMLALELCLRDGGATILEGPDAASGSAVTTIVCHPETYQSFVAQRNERYVALVRPEWVFRTFALQRLLPVDRFSPNPALLFSTLAISAGSMAKDPRKVLNGLVTHFGAQVVDQKEVYAGATHILYQDDAADDAAGHEEQEHHKLLQLNFSKTDLSRSVEAWRKHLAKEPAEGTYTLPTCVVAYMGQQAGLATQYHVKYTWIEECVRRQTRVPEGPFAHKPTGAAPTKANKKAKSWKTQPEVHLEDLNLSKCAQVYQLGKTELGTELAMVRKLSNEVSEFCGG
jgi:hypothetical protein